MGGGGLVGRTSTLLVAGGGDAGYEPNRYADDDRPVGGVGPIGRTSALLAAGGGDAGRD